MKILIYSHSFAPRYGGVETLVMLLAQGLAAYGKWHNSRIQVTVVTRTAQEEFNDASLPFRVVRQPGWWRLVRLLRTAEIVHLAGPSFLPLLLGLLLHKRIVLEHHGFQAICPNGQLFFEPTQTACPGHFMAGRHRECLRCNAKLGMLTSWKMWLLTFCRRWLSGKVDANITPTRWLDRLLQLPSAITIHHGVQNSADEALSVGPQVPQTFVFLGRLVSTKGAHLLLQAAHHTKAKGLAFQVKIVGDGPERANLENLARSLKLDDWVTFLGNVPPAELEHALRGASALVMPSLSGEVFGLAAAENMMCGRLSIVSDIGALSEVVGDSGLLFPPGDVQGLAACLEQAIKFPELTGALRQRAHERCMEFFSVGRMIDEHLAVYRRLLGGLGHPC